MKRKTFTKSLNLDKRDGLTSAESGGLFLVNVLGLGFFFAAASASTLFFFLYLAYVLNTGSQVYERGLGGIANDMKNFFHKFA